MKSQRLQTDFRRLGLGSSRLEVDFRHLWIDFRRLDLDSCGAESGRN
jgi:hypothetical protein